MKALLTDNKFDLQKVKRLNGGGITATFTTENQKGDQFFYPETTHKDEEMQHPDLDEVFDELKQHLLNIFGIKKDRAKDVTVTGVHFSGHDANEAVIVTGKIAGNGGVCALNTPRITIGTNEDGEFPQKYPHELEIRNITRRVTAETRAYLFNHKKAQADLFAENEKAGEIKAAV